MTIERFAQTDGGERRVHEWAGPTSRWLGLLQNP
jgi:hypothetical protein